MAGLRQAFPSLNGIEPSWADISLTAVTTKNALIDMSGLAAIKWERSVEVGVKRGASGGRKMSRTTGQGDVGPASITIYRSDWLQFQKRLVSEAPRRGNQARISLVVFDIVIAHTLPITANDDTIYNQQIRGCRYTKDSDDMKEGSDPDKIEVTLDVMEIVQIMDDGTEIVLL